MQTHQVPTAARGSVAEGNQPAVLKYSHPGYTSLRPGGVPAGSVRILRVGGVTFVFHYFFMHIIAPGSAHAPGKRQPWGLLQRSDRVAPERRRAVRPGNPVIFIIGQGGAGI